jgi:hypothetical protein
MSFLGNLFGGGPSNDQKQSNNLLNSAAQTGLNTGGQYLTSSQQNFAAPSTYYQSILSGNPAAVAGAVAPEVNQLNQGYANARRQVDQYAPLGGGRSSQITQMPFQQQGAITNLIAKARENAAQGLTGIGSAEGGIGSNLIGTGAQAANAFGNQATEQNLLRQKIAQEESLKNKFSVI